MESKKERAHANRTRPTNLHLQPQGGVRRCGDEVGGGLVDKRILYYDGYKEHKDNQKVTDVDLDKWDDGVTVSIGYTAKYANTNFNYVEISPSMYVNGKTASSVSGSYCFVKLSKQANGLWSLTVMESDYMDQPASTTMLRIMNVTGKRKATTATANYTEVSTMSITSDQPISAGNLKAALDGLTGGVAPEL